MPTCPWAGLSASRAPGFGLEAAFSMTDSQLTVKALINLLVRSLQAEAEALHLGIAMEL